MVYIDIIQKRDMIILDCHKETEDGERFQMIMDAKTMELLKRPEYPDIDASVAYSCVYRPLRDGKVLPKRTVAEWG